MKGKEESLCVFLMVAQMRQPQGRVCVHSKVRPSWRCSRLRRSRHRLKQWRRGQLRAVVSKTVKVRRVTLA